MRRPPLSPVSPSARLWLWPLLCCLGLLSACTSPYSERPSDPAFGQSVRSALKAQELPPSQAKTPAGVPYSEIEPALDRQQKAKPIEQTQNRSSQSGLGLMGP
jgi:hypothetical protein